MAINKWFGKIIGMKNPLIKTIMAITYPFEFIMAIIMTSDFKDTLQETWLEFLWCRERLQWESGMPRIGIGDTEIQTDENFPLCRESVRGMPRIEKRVRVRHGLLFWHTFGTVCSFFHSDLPSTHCTICWKWSFYKHPVCPTVCPFFRCRTTTLQPIGIDLCNFKI